MGMRMAPPWPAAHWEPEPAQRSLSLEECGFVGWESQHGMLRAPPALAVGAGTTRVHPNISQGPAHTPPHRAGWAVHTHTHSLAEGQWGEVPTLLHHLQDQGSAAHPGALHGMGTVGGFDR